MEFDALTNHKHVYTTVQNLHLRFISAPNVVLKKHKLGDNTILRGNVR
jgi:hypothetical protein